MLLAALLKLRVTPHSQGFSYETVYGKPSPIVRLVWANLPQVRADGISQQMEQLGQVINQVTKFVQERLPVPLGEQIHEFVPSDQVWVKDWKHDRLLGPSLEGSVYCCSNHPYSLRAIQALNTEQIQMRKVVIQNRMALDILTATQGGTCAIIKDE